MLKDDDVFVRMATARVLGELGSLGAAGALIDALGDAEILVREAAVVSLRLVTGKRFGFDPLGKEGDQMKAQGAWSKWLEKQGEG
jgi:HEAT repeat protein